MENKDLIYARAKELAFRASSQATLSHTDFLSLSEQNEFFSFLKNEHINPDTGRFLGARFCLYGGHEESDRKMIFFLPFYLEEEEFRQLQDDGDTISCLHIYPKNRRFSDVLTHRDYLGALMKLGYERDQFGDILSDGTDGYVFVNKQISRYVKEELVKIKHTTVEVDIILPKDCPFEQKFVEETIHIPSERIDCIIGEVFHLSRRSAQELIGKECVFVNGITMKNNSHVLKENSRVSIRGYGKFIYLANARLTKKGRLCAKVKRYC